MLVLTRKVGEEILIGESMILTIKEIAGNRVKLHFEGPKDIRIIRKELADIPESRRVARTS